MKQNGGGGEHGAESEDGAGKKMQSRVKVEITTKIEMILKMEMKKWIFEHPVFFSALLFLYFGNHFLDGLHILLHLFSYGVSAPVSWSS